MNNFVYHKNTIEFITVAKEFVALCEQDKKNDALKIVTIFHRILPLLYLKALLLPDFESNDEDIIEIVDEYSYNQIKKSFEELLGHLDIDCIIPETVSQNNEQNFAPLSEIFADIYQDLKTVLFNFQSGDDLIMENSLNLCKQNFEIYWGQRLLAALNGLHRLIFFQKDDLENIKPKTVNKIENTDTSEWIINKVQKNFRR
jgi:hypothetical protein